MKHVIDPMDLSVDETDEILRLAEDIMQNPPAYAKRCDGKILATLFYEASTRTRLSFESAMLSLGGNVIGFASGNDSSASKGESVADTIRVVSSYADICAIRHPKEGAALVAASHSRIPVMNAGDGGHQHPTQTLTDLLTIHSVKKRLHHLTVGVCGDLMFGRTVHSLLKSLSRYHDIRFILVSPEELKIPQYIREELVTKSQKISDGIPSGIQFQEVKNLEENIGEMDILYMTRVQRERFFNEDDYVRLKDIYVLNTNKLRSAKEDLAVLHPLPRVNEISADVDKDPRAYYFEQVRYGKFVRMALILKLLEESSC